ncbi:hypothetical protein D3C81_1473260 [compost metagenome]
MRCFENGMPRYVVDVGARRNTDAANLRCQSVGQVVAVQVQRSDNFEIRWPRQHLLQCDIGNRILDDDFAFGFRRLLCLVCCLSAGLFLDPVVFGPCEDFIAKFRFRDFITPVLESTFGKLHDIALVHQSDALTAMFDRIFDRGADEAFRTFF